jgi:site-specific recombinase XerD
VKRNDWEREAFLLIRHTGMRIGQCADLSFGCLRSTGPDPRAIHVPLGKLKTERMVPVDSPVGTLVHRLRLFRFLNPRPTDGLLLARRSTKDALVRQLRRCLYQVCHSLGFAARIIPHQLPYLRHGNVSCRGRLSHAYEVTRPHFFGHDDALCRSGAE